MKEFFEIDFHKVTIEDKTWIQPLLDDDQANICDRAFATTFLYRNQYQYEVAKICGCYVNRCRYQTIKDYVPFWVYSFPIGNGDKRAALEVLLQLCKQEDIPLHMEPILPAERELLLDWFPGQFNIEAIRHHFDYIYDREKLAYLKGKKMQKKRNHISRFKDGDDWSYEPITELNMAETRAMTHDWIGSRANKWNSDMEREFSVLESAFDNFDALGLRGGILRKGDRIVAMTMGEPINDDTFDVHFEKAYANVQGAYPMINQQFVQHATDGFSYINREDDMGDPGLRKAKLSYYPDLLQKKYRAETSDVVMADPQRDKEAIHSIWRQCFNDDDEFIDFYIDNRMTDSNMLAIYQDGKAVSMASFLPISIEVDNPAYQQAMVESEYAKKNFSNLAGASNEISEAEKLSTVEKNSMDIDIPKTITQEALYGYAFATLPAYQGQGLFSRIIAYAKSHWNKPILVCTLEDSLQSIYVNLDFRYAYQKQNFKLNVSSNAVEADKAFKSVDNNLDLSDGALDNVNDKNSTVKFTAAMPEQYKALRDEKFAGDGYVIWDKEGIGYAIQHAAYFNGETLIVEYPLAENQDTDHSVKMGSAEKSLAAKSLAETEHSDSDVKAKLQKTSDAAPSAKQEMSEKMMKRAIGHGPQFCLMYMIVGDTLIIIETTLTRMQLQDILPQLLNRIKEKQGKVVVNAEYLIPDGLLWSPCWSREANVQTSAGINKLCAVNLPFRKNVVGTNGYFNLPLA